MAKISPSGTFGRIVLFIAACDIITGLYSLFAFTSTLVESKHPFPGYMVVSALMILVFIVGFGIILAVGAWQEQPRLLAAWLIPNLILITIFIVLILIASFTAYAFTVYYAGFGEYAFVRGLAILMVYELYMHLKEEQDPTRLINETGPEL